MGQCHRGGSTHSQGRKKRASCSWRSVAVAPALLCPGAQEGEPSGLPGVRTRSTQGGLQLQCPWSRQAARSGAAGAGPGVWDGCCPGEERCGQAISEAGDILPCRPPLPPLGFLRCLRTRAKKPPQGGPLPAGPGPLPLPPPLFFPFKINTPAPTSSLEGPAPASSSFSPGTQDPTATLRTPALPLPPVSLARGQPSPLCQPRSCKRQNATVTQASDLTLIFVGF